MRKQEFLRADTDDEDYLLDNLDDIMEIKEEKGITNEEALKELERINSNEEKTKNNIVNGTSFDDVIGYDDIKEKLNLFLGYIKNPTPYKELGVDSPKGILLFGNPGTGKTMLSSAFINAAKLPYYIVHKFGDESFTNKYLEKVFEKARENAPSIILIDDMYKLASNKNNRSVFHCIQSLIDSVKKEDVYIIATVNDIDMLPNSLLRDGRFDSKIFVDSLTEKDKKLLLDHYLKGKKLEKGINTDDIAAATTVGTPAEIKTSINTALMVAAPQSRRRRQE